MKNPLIEQLGMNAAEGAIDTGLGLLTAKWNDQRQIEQQKKLNQLQEQSQLKMWEATNYKAQRQQLEKAGLNVGLLYGMGGGQGATTGSFNSGQAPQGGGELGMGIMTKAQLELIHAQTQNVKADTAAKEAGIPKTQQDTKTGAATEANLQADTANKQLENQLLQIKQSIQQQTIAESVQQIQEAAKQAIAKTTSDQAQATIDQNTTQERIAQTHIATYQAILQTALTKATSANVKSDTAKNQAQLNEIAKRIWKMQIDAAQKGQELDQNQQRIEISQMLANLEQQMTEFKTSTPEQIKQWTGVSKDLVETIQQLQQIAPVKKVIGFK